MDMIDKDPPLCFHEHGIDKERYTEFGLKHLDEIVSAIRPIANSLIEQGVSTRDVQALIIEASMDIVLPVRLG